MTDAYSLSSSFINQPLPLDFVWTAPPDLYNNINNNFPDQPNLYPTDPHPTSSSTPSHFNLIKREHDNSGLMYGANGTNPALVWNNYQTAMNAASFENYQYKMANFSALKHKDLKPMMVENNPPYRTGPGTNNVRVRTSDKYRMVYSEHQRLELEKDYITNEFITTERKAQLSMDLKLTERQIKIWFQNRRAKDRREKSKLNDMPLH
uniref:Homeobox domain-containing protein n=1 Tax=Rhabditophanes sp. KR3021 TaxID=114890 RepID=A0AC35UE14_9BILA